MVEEKRLPCVPDRLDNASEFNGTDGCAWEERGEKEMIPRTDNRHAVTVIEILEHAEGGEAGSENQNVGGRIVWAGGRQKSRLMIGVPTDFRARSVSRPVGSALSLLPGGAQQRCYPAVNCFFSSGARTSFMEPDRYP